MTKGINPFSFSSLCPCMETAVWATFGCSVGCCWLVNYLEAQITGITPVFLLSSLIFTQPGEGEVTPVYRALLISVTRDQTWKPPPRHKINTDYGKKQILTLCSEAEQSHFSNYSVTHALSCTSPPHLNPTHSEKLGFSCSGTDTLMQLQHTDAFSSMLSEY